MRPALMWEQWRLSELVRTGQWTRASRQADRILDLIAALEARKAVA